MTRDWSRDIAAKNVYFRIAVCMEKRVPNVNISQDVLRPFSKAIGCWRRCTPFNRH